MKTDSHTISFRLSAELLRKLDKKREPFGDSRGQFSKRLVTASLLGSRDEELLGLLTELRQVCERSDDESSRRHESMSRAIRRLAFSILTADKQLSADEGKRVALGLFHES